MVLLIAAFMLRGMPMVTAAISSDSAVLVYGIISLGFGVAMMVNHNVWAGGPLAVVVTLLGWADFSEGSRPSAVAVGHALAIDRGDALWRPLLPLSRALARDRRLPDLGRLSRRRCGTVGKPDQGSSLSTKSLKECTAS